MTACMKYIHYMETDNKLLKRVYKCETTDETLQEICKLVNIEKQISNFIRTRLLASQKAPRFCHL